jgi:hypothetical protein
LDRRPARGPVRRESPPPSTAESNRARPESLSSFGAVECRGAACCPGPAMGRLRPSESALRPHRSRFTTPPPGSLDVHSMYRCTSAIPMSERSAPAQDRRLRARSLRGPVLLAPRVVRDDVSAGRGALGSESEDSGLRAARPTASIHVCLGYFVGLCAVSCLACLLDVVCGVT